MKFELITTAMGGTADVLQDKAKIALVAQIFRHEEDEIPRVYARFQKLLSDLEREFPAK